MAKVFILSFEDQQDSVGTAYQYEDSSGCGLVFGAVQNGAFVKVVAKDYFKNGVRISVLFEPEQIDELTAALQAAKIECEQLRDTHSQQVGNE